MEGGTETGAVSARTDAADTGTDAAGDGTDTAGAETIVCPACGREINKKEAEKNLYACYECGSYFRVRTKNRIRMLADNGTFEPWFEDIPEVNPLDFPGYEEKVGAAKEKTGLHEAVTVGRCQIYGEETVLGICDARFLMSSMGHVVGEKIALAVERRPGKNYRLSYSVVPAERGCRRESSR